jgi:tetratricopeptide (TPR) repeat protein
MESFRAVLDQFDNALDPQLRKLAADAQLNEGHALQQLNRLPEAIERYTDFTNRYGEDASPGLRIAVAKSFNYCGAALRATGKEREARACFAAVVSRYESASERSLLEQVEFARSLLADQDKKASD